MRAKHAVTLTVLAAIAASVGVVAGASRPEAAAGIDPPTRPALTAAIDPQACFTPDSRVPITITHAAPHGRLGATTRATVDAIGRADDHGRGRLVLIAPSVLPPGAATAVRLVTVGATTADGDTTITAAFLLGSRTACRQLRRIATAPRGG